tara:strand:+ start:950 stop:1198 length:249 start_codon:yes stop_codon:yes gene_type:complete
MTRLTVHLEEPIFTERDQKNVGTKENPIMQPKKKKCIKNTLSFRNVSENEAGRIISDVRKEHGIAKWKEGKRKGLEMIYTVN